MSSPGPRRAPTVLVVDDDATTRTLIVRSLAREGIAAHEAVRVDQALELVDDTHIDLVLLDVMLPGTTGFDALPRFRERRVPVILVTGRDDVTDRVLGLELGADDYVVKPFEPRELTSRVRAVLRRSGRGGDRDQPFQAGDLAIDPGTREVRLAGRPVTLTVREFDLLAYLVARPRRVCTYDELLEQVWHSSSEWQGTRTVTEHIRRLRLKIETDPRVPVRLRAERGVGYRFEP